MSLSQATHLLLGDVLVHKGHLTDEQLEAALAAQQESGHHGKLLGELLVELELCSDEQVVESLAEAYGVPFATLETRLFDPALVDLLPREFIERNLVLPLFVVEGVLTLAVSEPSDLFLIDEAISTCRISTLNLIYIHVLYK